MKTKNIFSLREFFIKLSLVSFLIYGIFLWIFVMEPAYKSQMFLKKKTHFSFQEFKQTLKKPEIPVGVKILTILAYPGVKIVEATT